MNLREISAYLPHPLHDRKSGTDWYSGSFRSSDNQKCCGDAADRTAPSLLTLEAKPSVKQDANSIDPRRVKSLFEDCSDDENVDFKGWESKPIEEWTEVDTRNWLFCASQKLGQFYREITPELAVLPGKKLLLLSRHDFLVHDHCFGEELYDLLREILDSENSVRFSDYQRDSREVLDFKLDLQSDGGSPPWQESDSTDEESVENNSERKKRGRGRPRSVESKVREVGPKVWEFIRNLLLDPQYCPDWIRWENYDEKTFRFVDTQKVAKRWGARNKNGRMNFEKFSRAMRYYYDKDILKSVPRRRLVYQFGPLATGLDEIESPNSEAGCLKRF